MYSLTLITSPFATSSPHPTGSSQRFTRWIVSEYDPSGPVVLDTGWDITSNLLSYTTPEIFLETELGGPVYEARAYHIDWLNGESEYGWARFNEFGITEAEAGELFPDPCSLLLEVFGDDRETLLFDVSTWSLHPRPYLDLPAHYGEHEIDIVNGAATIGQVEVTVVDASQIIGDQDSGWMTAQLNDLHGRRCRLRRFINETIGWQTIADGPAGPASMDESYSAYRWIIKDTRESERKTTAFETTETTALWPAGILGGFAGLPGVESLAGQIGYISNDATSRTFMIEFAVVPGWPSGYVLRSDREWLMPEVEQVMNPPIDGPVYRYTYNQIRLMWREPGAGAFTVVDAPYVDWLGSITSRPFLTTVFPDNVDATTALGAELTAPMPAWIQALWDLGDTAPVEVLLMPLAMPTSKAFPHHLHGLTVGQVLQNLYDGVYSPRDENDNIVPTGIRYDPAALAQMTDPVTMKLTEPVENVREWAESLLYAADGWVPALDNDGEISPVTQVPPESFDGLPVISNDNAEPAPNWNVGELIINTLWYTYPRHYVPADPDVPTDGDGLAKIDVNVRFVDPDSVRAHGTEKVEYDGSAFAAIGNGLGDALGTFLDPTNVQNELGWQRAQSLRLYVFDRYRKGAQAVSVAVMRSEFPTVRTGAWVIMRLSWFPDYVTRRRGMNTGGQIMSIKELDCAWREFLIEEALPVISPVS